MGVSCIVARSFGQIFYRNAFNRGLPLLECDWPKNTVNMGDRLRVNLESGEIKNLTSNLTFQAAPIPDIMREIITAGGLIPVHSMEPADHSSPGLNRATS